MKRKYKYNQGLKSKKHTTRINTYSTIQSSSIYSKPIKTSEGFLRVDIVIASMGVLPYQEIDESGELYIKNELIDNSIYSKEFLDSCEGMPFVLEHPQDAEGNFTVINSENYKDLIKGAVSSPRIDKATNRVIGTLTIYDKEIIELVESGELEEVSQGYKCTVIEKAGTHEGEKYDAIQKNMIMNHFALVPEGRAGKKVRILFNSKSSSLKINNILNGRKERMEKEIAELSAKLDSVSDNINKLVEVVSAVVKKPDTPTVNEEETDPKPPETPEKKENEEDTPSPDEVKKEVLNSMSADIRNQAFQNMNETTDTFSKARAIFGADLEAVASKFNTLEELKRHALVKSGDFTQDEADKFNTLQVNANFDATVRSAKSKINDVKHNSKGFASDEEDASLSDY